MHPQIVADKPGTCPICGMDLVVRSPDREQDDTRAKIDMGGDPLIRMQILAAMDTGDAERFRVHVHVRGRDASARFSLERLLPDLNCLGPTAQLQLLYAGMDRVFVDASVVCQLGANVVRQTVDHTIVEVTDDAARILFRGRSEASSQEEISVDRNSLEFYVEAGRVAVYRHRVKWCDDAMSRAELGYGCGRDSNRRRTLRLLKRVGGG